MSEPASFTPEDWDTCIRVLQVLSRRPEEALDVQTLKGLVTKLAARARKQARREAVASDRALVAATGGWRSGLAANHPLHAPLPEPASPSARLTLRLHAPRSCYVCKRQTFELHPHYHQHCPACGDFEEARRAERVDLTGRTALVTGGRIKIGREIALRLLRDGARVLVTTRFPHDAARRFGAERDFEHWRERLHIFGLNLLQLPRVESFVEHLGEREPALDILINNAAQTIRREAAFHEHLRAVEGEALPRDLRALVTSPEHAAPGAPTAALAEASPWLPPGLLDRDGQQVDLSAANSWTAEAGEVSMTELLEVLLVSQTAPFLLANRLRPLLARSPRQPRFIIHVSAMEGQFERVGKTSRHPHTNMAKAAVNMFTRTSAQDFARDQIWMNSVDTGWITDENPHPKKTRVLQGQGFVPPLDAIDGAARIYDPIVRGLTSPGEPLFGHFLKDFRPHAW